MKTEYKTKHLSRGEMERLIKNTAMNGESDHAHEHLKECSLCNEAYEGLKALPDLKSLEVLNSKWKLKSGIKPSPRKLEINLPALYTLLTLIGLISIAVIYFFFFNPKNNKPVVTASNKASVATTKTIVNDEHFIVAQNTAEARKNTSEVYKVNETPAKGIYDEIKKPEAALEKLQPITASKQIPEVTLDLIKGNSNEPLLNIEDFKIIDYTSIYTKNENTLQSFSEGLSARYENTKNLNQNIKEEQLSTSIVSYEEVMAGALRNYKKARFTEAVNDLNFILKYFPEDKNAQFYKALCYNDAGEYQKAIDILKPLAAINSHTFYQEAKWHLAVCYRLSGDVAGSKKLLAEIIKEGGFYKKQAEKEME